MITIRREIRINTGTAPFTYNWSTSSPCLSFSQISGTVSTVGGVIETDITYTDEDCFGIVTLTVTDAKNCTSTQDFSLGTPCTLQANPITNTNNLTFSTFGLNGSGDYSYQWNWDDTYFSLKPNTDGNNSILDLQFNNPPSDEFPTTIFVTITDNVTGCTIELQHVYTFCGNEIPDREIQLFCVDDQTCSVFIPLFLSTKCLPVDWPTLEISNNPDVTIIQEENRVKFCVTTTEPQITLTYQVADIFGNLTNTANITLNIPQPCPDNKAPVFADFITEACTLDPITIDPIDFLVSNSKLNFTTLAVVTPANAGTVSINVGGTFTYTPNSPISATTDAFKFSVSDNDGLSSGTVCVFINLDCPVCPIVNPISSVVDCGSMNNQITLEGVVDPTVVNLNTVQVIDVPTNGFVTTTNGSFLYTPGFENDTDTSFTYQFTTFDGEQCTGVVNIQVNTCCENNNLTFTCNQVDDEFCITAIPSMPGVTSFSKDGVNFIQGTEYCIEVGCTRNFETIYREMTDASLRITNAGSYYYFQFEGITDPQTILDNFCLNGSVFRVIVATTAGPQVFNMFRNNISNIATTNNGLYFEYVDNPTVVSNDCESLVLEDVNGTYELLNSFADTYEVEGPTMSFVCLSYLGGVNPNIIFKHEVTDCPCIEYSVSFNPTVGCGSLQVIKSSNPCQGSVLPECIDCLSELNASTVEVEFTEVLPPTIEVFDDNGTLKYRYDRVVINSVNSANSVEQTLILDPSTFQPLDPCKTVNFILDFTTPENEIENLPCGTQSGITSVKFEFTNGIPTTPGIYDIQDCGTVNLTCQVDAYDFESDCADNLQLLYDIGNGLEPIAPQYLIDSNSFLALNPDNSRNFNSISHYQANYNSSDCQFNSTISTVNRGAAVQLVSSFSNQNTNNPQVSVLLSGANPFSFSPQDTRIEVEDPQTEAIIIFDRNNLNPPPGPNQVFPEILFQPGVDQEVIAVPVRLISESCGICQEYTINMTYEASAQQWQGTLAGTPDFFGPTTNC